MMLSTDLALFRESDTRPIVEEYATSQDTFFTDFSSAWQKLVELGYNDNQLYTVNPVKTEL